MTPDETGAKIARWWEHETDEAGEAAHAAKIAAAIRLAVLAERQGIIEAICTLSDESVKKMDMTYGRDRRDLEAACNAYHDACNAIRARPTP